MSRLISTSDLHNVVTKRKAEYGKLATLVDNIVEDMVKETPTAIRIPEGATNGDMIKAMFPDLANSNLKLVDVLLNTKSWWNAPYRKVEE